MAPLGLTPWAEQLYLKGQQNNGRSKLEVEKNVSSLLRRLWICSPLSYNNA